MNNLSIENQHEFAIYLASLDEIIKNNTEKPEFYIQDKTLVHRLVAVLRLQKGSICIFFNKKIHAQVKLLDRVKKDTILFKFLSVFNNQEFQPNVAVFLPILKRSALEETVYSFAELGVNTIQLIKTKKVQRSWGGKKELERLERIIISACEQSKNYVLSDILEPIEYSVAIENCQSNVKLFFDFNAPNLHNFCKKYVEKKQDIDTITVLIGPEGDLTPEEKKYAIKNNFEPYSLTPTVLRSLQAAALATGFVRSFFR